MDTKEINEFINLLDETEELKPAISKVIQSLRILSPDIVELLSDIGNYIVDARAKSVKRLVEKHGFSKKQAIMLTLDIQSNILNSLNSSKGRK